MQLKVITLILIILLSLDLFSQGGGISLQFNNIFYSVADEKVSTIDQNLSFPPRERANSIGFDLFATYTLNINDEKFFILRVGYKYNFAESNIKLNRTDGYVSRKSNSINETYTVSAGIGKTVISSGRLNLNVFTNIFGSYNFFGETNYQSSFYDNDNLFLGLSGFDINRTPLWRVGFVLGYSINYNLNNKISLGLELGIPIYMIFKNGTTIRRVYNLDTNSHLTETKSFHNERDNIITKGIRFSPGIKWYF